MGDETNVGLVDAHAERDGGDDDDSVFAQKASLVSGAHPGVETRVVRQRVESAGLQELGRRLDALAAERIDDSRIVRVLGLDETEQLLAWLGLVHDAVLDVRPVEACDEVLRLAQLQPGGDLPVRRIRRRSGECDPRHGGPAVGQLRQCEIVGPKVVAPLRHTVGFVDGEKCDLTAVEKLLRCLRREALGCDVEQIEVAGDVVAFDLVARLVVLAGIQKRGAHADGGEGVDLVLHESNERGDHDAGARTHE